MYCIVCNHEMSYYFTKQFNYHCLANVDYWKCACCGFVASKTHFDLPHEEWASLNEAFHTHAETLSNPGFAFPPYAQQAQMLYTMRQHSLLSTDRAWLDWRAGPGKLSQHLKEQHDLDLLNFDRYLPSSTGCVIEEQLDSRAFSLVVTSAVFEHVRSRATLDEIESRVSTDGGALAIHTVVCGSIPKDPGWFYLLPVHCAFHTNRSMQLLMDQWGYTCSVYNENTKFWVMFRHETAEILDRIQRINALAGREYLHYKKGFMDFWP